MGSASPVLMSNFTKSVRPGSYKIQTDERIIPMVNVQQLNLAEQERVGKITTVLEDTETEALAESFAGASIQTQVLSKGQQTQLDATLNKHESVLAKETGLFIFRIFPGPTQLTRSL